jgi:cobalt-zinc-cadmium efflux system membrane fusion protein
MQHRTAIPVILLVLMASTFFRCAGERKDATRVHDEPLSTGEQKNVVSAPSDPRAEGQQTVTLKRESIAAMGLAVSRAEIRPLIGRMNLPARVRPNQDLEAHVGSLVQGRVKEVFVTVGQFVRANQELMRIEGLEVGEIKSDFIKARAQLTYAELNHRRQKTLLEEKVGSQKVYLEAEAEYNKSLAEFDAVDKKIHSIGLTDSDVVAFVGGASLEENGHTGGVLPIKAPIAGIVAERNVVIGQLVDASATAFKIVNTTTLWADGQIYERDLQRLSRRTDVVLTVTAYPGETFPGKIIYVSPAVDEQSRTITVRASIPNAGGRLKPQMFGELHVPIGESADALIIPTESVQHDGAATFVFVALSDTSFERREVTLGAAIDAAVEVKSGIRPGEKVVTRGSFQLKSELMKEALEEGE